MSSESGYEGVLVWFRRIVGVGIVLLVTMLLFLLLGMIVCTVCHEMGHYVSAWLINPDAIEKVNLIDLNALLRSLLSPLTSGAVQDVQAGGWVEFTDSMFTVFGVWGAHLVAVSGLLASLVLWVVFSFMKRRVDWTQPPLLALPATFSFEVGLGLLVVSGWMGDYINVILYRMYRLNLGPPYTLEIGIFAALTIILFIPVWREVLFTYSELQEVLPQINTVGDLIRPPRT